MLMLKILGLVTLVYSFFLGINKWIEEEEKENLQGLLLSFVVVIGAMFGVIYLINN